MAENTSLGKVADTLESAADKVWNPLKNGDCRLDMVVFIAPTSIVLKTAGVAARILDTITRK